MRSGGNYEQWMDFFMEAVCEAAEDGMEYVYISTNHEGLYEKYGYAFYQMMKDIGGEDSRVYRKCVKK